MTDVPTPEVTAGSRTGDGAAGSRTGDGAAGFRTGDRTRTGAVWVTALGAFMLFAAAAVFVAVRWDDLADSLKLGILGALTGSCLLAGRRLRTALPATAGVLFHLGAFLVPVNVAAVAVHLAMEWPAMLLLEGVTATATWAVLGRRSRILSCAAVAAAVVAAAGLSATVAGPLGGPTIPTAVLLALAAVAAEVTATAGRRSAGRRSESRRAEGAALAWALVAGAAPVLALVEQAVPLGTDVTALLGLTGSGPRLTPPPAAAAAVSGVLAAGVLGRMAARREDPVLVVAAATSLALGVVSTWIGLAPTAGASLVGGAALFLMIEATAAAVAGDAFWKRPAAIAAGIAEIAAGVVSAFALIVALEDFATKPSRIVGLPIAAAVLAAGGWLVADLRRRTDTTTTTRIWGDLWPNRGLYRTQIFAGAQISRGWAPATAGLAAAVMAGVLAGTRQADAVALTAVALAALLVLTARSGGHPVAVALVVGAPLAQPVTPVAVATGVTGALVLAVAAVARAWWAAPPPPGATPAAPPPPASAPPESVPPASVPPWSQPVGAAAPPARPTRTAAWLLTLASLLALVETAVVLAWRHRMTDPGPPLVLAGLILAATLVAAVLDREPDPAPAGPRHRVPVRLAGAGRAAAVLALIAGSGLPEHQLVVLAVLATGLALIDAVRLDRPGPLWALPVTLPYLVVAAARATGVDWPATGVVLGVLAVVCAGVHILADTAHPAAGGVRWGTALLVTAGTSAFVAVILTAPSPASFATVVIIIGTIGIMLGAAHRHPELTVIGVVVGTVGVWLHLVAAGVDALDAYAAPVALALVAAGWWAERSDDGDRPVSSWVTYAPAVLLLGGAALAERAAGGGGIHALVAGAVALVAVIAGGSRRWIGPLLAGTILLVALTVHESLGVSRQVPTWAWLAAGGAALVATGLWLERRETGPVEAGRRLVDVVTERFS